MGLLSRHFFPWGQYLKQGDECNTILQVDLKITDVSFSILQLIVGPVGERLLLHFHPTFVGESIAALGSTTL